MTDGHGGVVAGEEPAPVDWGTWHASYDQAGSPLSQRLALVQRETYAALERAPSGPLSAISVCAGQGHDLLGVLAVHPRRDDVRARLVEIDPANVRVAREAAGAVGLEPSRSSRGTRR